MAVVAATTDFLSSSAPSATGAALYQELSSSALTTTTIMPLSSTITSPVFVPSSTNLPSAIPLNATSVATNFPKSSAFNEIGSSAGAARFRGFSAVCLTVILGLLGAAMAL